MPDTRQRLRAQALEANLELNRRGLVIYTWGNVSLIDREAGLIAIKPSGVSYDEMTAESMVLLDLEGHPLPGETYRPSSDTATHVVLYRAFPEACAVVHTHSTHATAWAQSGRDIPCLGTTHADSFYGAIPCTRGLTPEEVQGEYERATGEVIVETFRANHLSPAAVPGVLCRGHGPFAWGKSAMEAVYHAAVLEEVARMALLTELLHPNLPPIDRAIMDKHYERKHGAAAYYGQPGADTKG